MRIKYICGLKSSFVAAFQTLEYIVTERTGRINKMYKLLIVEDNNVQIQSLLYYLEWEKYGIDEIKIAYNGQEGLDLYKQFKPDIILTDIGMPVMNGLDMIMNIRRMGAEPQVIYFSCYDDRKYMQKAIELDAAAYLFKPVDRKELSNAVSHTVHRLRQDQHKDNAGDIQHTKYLEALRENFLYHIIYSQSWSMQYLNDMYERMEFSGISLFAFAVLRVVYLEEEVSEERFALIASIREKLLDKVQNVLITDGDDSIAILLMGNADDREGFSSEVRIVIGDCIKDGRENHGMIIMSGMSDITASFYDIPFLYRQAVTALENNLASDDDRVNTCKSHTLPDDYYNVEVIKSNIEKLVQYPDETEKNRFISDYCRLSDNDTYTIETRYVSFFAALQMYLTEQHILLSSVFGSSNITLNRGAKFVSMEQLRQWIYNILTEISEYVNVYSSKKNEETVKEIIDYINQNYTTVSNVEQIAQHCFISASYARKIFKDFTGKTIYEYIMLTRMDKAKQLLSRNDLPVYEIAEHVGYKSRTNFVNAFKKYTGLLPSQFRSKMLGGEQGGGL